MKPQPNEYFVYKSSVIKYSKGTCDNCLFLEPTPTGFLNYCGKHFQEKYKIRYHYECIIK